MNLTSVKELGRGTIIDQHGHVLSGAAKMTYLVYRLSTPIGNLNPALIERGKRIVEKFKDVNVTELISCNI